MCFFCLFIEAALGEGLMCSCIRCVIDDGFNVVAECVVGIACCVLQVFEGECEYILVG